MNKKVFTSDWFSGNIANWSQWLAHLKGQPASALEIGSYEGQSACWLLENILTHENSRLTCIDTWAGGQDLPEVSDDSLFERFAGNIGATGQAGRVAVFRGPSERWLPVLQTEGRKFNVIYVDGSHLAPDVLTDGVLGWRLLEPGGLIIFDDYTWCHDPNPLHQPGLAINAFLAVWAGQYEVVGKAYQVALRKLKL